MKTSNMVKCFATSAALLIGSSAAAQELLFQFNNPNFGGNPLNGSFLFGLAEAQRTATINDFGSGGGANPGAAPIPGIGGGDVIGGPTIVIPIGDLGPDGVDVDAGVGSGDSN